MDDFAAQTHRSDAGRAENPENEPRWMHGAACGCVMGERIFLCERRVAAVTYPFCSGLMDENTCAHVLDAPLMAVTHRSSSIEVSG